jgi:biopolymer transport protein ExbB/TolQ/biopolymer transport protein ExbD
MIHSIGEAFKEGGWGMWPILAILLISLAITIERVLYLTRASFDARTFMAQLGSLLQSGNIPGAVGLCQQTDKPLARILGAGFARSNEGIHRVQTAMDEAAYGEMPRIEKRTGYLALMGNIATLTGLLGTILGLIKSFRGVSKEAAADKATLLAAGISEAMNCTAFGLLTGISALLAYSVLNGKTQSMLDEINHLSLSAFRMWRAAAGAGGEHQVRKPITSPAPHLMHHLMVGKKKGGHGHKKSTFASLQLTPMIDMFIVVLIFLLMTFSASGEILFVTKDIKLPFADKVEKLDRAPVIAVSFPEGDPAGGVVTLDGSEVSTARELREDDSPDWKIAKLTEQLEVKKHNWKLTNPDKQFPGEVIVQADQNVDFKIIKKVMYSCGLAGYSNVHFAVTQKTGKSGET